MSIAMATKYSTTHWFQPFPRALSAQMSKNIGRAIPLSLRMKSTAVAEDPPQEKHRGDKSKSLWGGRFTKGTADSVKAWVDSTWIDEKMGREDMWGSIAHVSMLGATESIPPEDACAIVGELAKLHDTFLAGQWHLDPEYDDVHMNVEKALIDRIGMDVAGKMHTTRSRNDQVALDARMLARTMLLELRSNVNDAAEAFIERSEQHLDDVMIAYTHVQHAQPVSIAYWLQAYAASFVRAAERLETVHRLTNLNPLGGGAIAGTSFPIDRFLTTELLGFSEPLENGLDAIGARDYMLDALSANATLGIEMSRLADEFIMWSSYEFGTLVMDDGFAMGSSMMPQKKNPGPLELMRGRAGRLIGYHTAGMSMLKGLPSGYNRDFHEEKEILYRSYELATSASAIVPALVRTTTINTARMEQLAYKNFGSATEIANYLVRVHAVPFRQAHHIVGSFVGEMTRQGRNFEGCETDLLAHLKERGVANATDSDVRHMLEPKLIVQSYESYGGTGPKSVAAASVRLRERLTAMKASLAKDQQVADSAYERCLNIARSAGANPQKSGAELRKLIEGF